MCCYAERCANAHVLEFNGDLYACDHFVYRPWKIGNILATPLADLARSQRLDEFAAMKTELPAACRDCEFLDLCHGGCPKHHRPIGTDPDRVNHFCEGYKMFYREALGELRRIAGYFREGRPPSPREAPPAPTALPPRSHTAGGPTPGRNTPCPCGSGKKFKNCCGTR